MRESQTKSRRGFMLGAAVAGAAATAAVALPKLQGETPVSETPPPPERGGGYRLSEHVKQYYKTTLV
jgi:hypothetical protein